MDQASSTPRSRTSATGRLRTKTGLPASAGPSPCITTCAASSSRPARSSRASSRVPVHRACPTAARPQARPRAGGSKNRRPLPAHSRMSRRVSAGSDTTSAWSSVRGALTRPSTRSRHEPASTSGTGPCERTKKCSTGVSCPISSSARPSMFRGSSLRTIKSGFICYFMVHLQSALPQSQFWQGSVLSSGWYDHSVFLAPGDGRRGDHYAGRPSVRPTTPTRSPPPKGRRLAVAV